MEKTESPLSSILSRVLSGDIPTIEDACRTIHSSLNDSLPDPYDYIEDPSDYDAGYYDGIVDARDVDRIIIADFCGQTKRDDGKKR